MDRFLTGFVDELCKLAQPSMGTLSNSAFQPVRPPTTAPVGAGPPARPPPNSFSATPAFSQAIPRQGMYSPPKPQQQTWRPSPTFKPEAPPPAAAAPAPRGGGGGRGASHSSSPAGVPFESSSTALARGLRERWSQATFAGKQQGVGATAPVRSARTTATP